MELKTGRYIANILCPVIDKVGPENVVAVCTDCSNSYALADKKIATTWPHIEHVPFATHVLDLIMEDVGKMSWAKVVVVKAGEMINFVRNHDFTLAFMKNPSLTGGKGKQVLMPAGSDSGHSCVLAMRDKEDEMIGGQGEEGEDAVLADEYEEGVVVEKPRKEIGCGEAS
ncbi:unnamed protein product [Closterium sp. NIES-64]|nr:unnamed protein product [Closterium sp. NIES-64]